LFFRICEIVKAKRPRVLFLENVKNLKSHDKGRTWQVIQGELAELDYCIHTKVIDARSWVPQHRERIFIVGFDRCVFGDNVPFEFPEHPRRKTRLGDILEAEPPERYTLTAHLWEYLQNYAAKHRALGNGFQYGLFGPDDIARTLSARYYKDGSEILIRQPRKRPRRLTPVECARLLGFPEQFAQNIIVSDTQAYRQFGNAVCPLVVGAIARKFAPLLLPHVKRQETGLLFA
jgi:DNA (cytosine-5)-methyltransferase 1